MPCGLTHFQLLNFFSFKLGMVRISGVEVSTDEATEIFFSDHRVNRMLVSILSVNTSIALPSLILLIPVYDLQKYLYFDILSVNNIQSKIDSGWSFESRLQRLSSTSLFGSCTFHNHFSSNGHHSENGKEK